VEFLKRSGEILMMTEIDERYDFFMDDTKLNHYKHLLEQHREHHLEILDDMENLTLGENDNNASSELSTYDNHPAEIASELFDMEHHMGLRKLQEHEVDDIKRAKDKIKQGTYGKCELCGKDIDPKRLELLPQARMCIDCARESDVLVQEMKEDRKKNRPAEEQVLHSSNINDSSRGEQFNDLMEYGSSDSHQDRGGKLVDNKITWKT
jgi:RNA polymerase-binding transcription factor DksA